MIVKFLLKINKIKKILLLNPKVFKNLIRNNNINTNKKQIITKLKLMKWMDFYLAIKIKIVNFNLRITLMIIDYQIKIIYNLISLLADLNNNSNLQIITFNIIFKTISTLF